MGGGGEARGGNPVLLCATIAAVPHGSFGRLVAVCLSARVLGGAVLGAAVGLGSSSLLRLVLVVSSIVRLVGS